MSSLSSERYGMTLAPGGLALLQEVMNTGPQAKVDAPDLLSDIDAAQGWLDAAIEEWARRNGTAKPSVVLGDGDLPRLRQLRAFLARGAGDASVPGSTRPSVKGSLDIELDASGFVTTSPRGTGATWVSSAVVAETYKAQIEGTFARLKVCANPTCGVAFYDRSRNASGTWHDVRICGNAINLRASRQNRKSAIDKGISE